MRARIWLVCFTTSVLAASASALAMGYSNYLEVPAVQGVLSLIAICGIAIGLLTLIAMPRGQVKLW